MSRIPGAWMIAFAFMGACTNDSSVLPGERVGFVANNFTGAKPCAALADHDADGTTDVAWAYDYDAHGRIVLDHGHRIGGGAETTVEFPTIAYTWDNLDHLTHLVADTFPGNVQDFVAIYDTLGTELETTYTVTFSGGYTAAHAINSQFDAAGHPTRMVQTNTHMQDGQLITLPPDANDLTYDELGRLVLQQLDHGNNGSVETNVAIVYDDPARTTTITIDDLDGTGTTSLSIVRTFDASNHLLSHVEHELHSGVTTIRESISDWSGDRRLKLSELENGELVSRTTYHYDCAP